MNAPWETRIRSIFTEPVRLAQRVRVRRSVGKPPLPNFLIIGAMKGGTNWLRRNLDKHPDVVAARREVWYFSHNFERGPDWYRQSFQDWDGERAVGESSPTYMVWRGNPPLMARRIDENLPGVRLFALLRDPCDRALSAFIHHMGQHRIPPETDLLEYIESVPPEQDRLQLIVGGWYAASLAPFLERFGERLLVFLNEDIRDHAPDVYRRALAHIDVDPNFTAEGVENVVFSTPAPEASNFHTRGGGRRSLTDAERAVLYPYFADDIDRLEGMLGRDLSRWRPQRQR